MFISQELGDPLLHEQASIQHDTMCQRFIENVKLNDIYECVIDTNYLFINYNGEILDYYGITRSKHWNTSKFKIELYKNAKDKFIARIERSQ